MKEFVLGYKQFVRIYTVHSDQIEMEILSLKEIHAKEINTTNLRS